MKPKVHYTLPSITELEVGYATDAARNGWGERCYDYLYRFEAQFKQHLGVRHAEDLLGEQGAEAVGRLDPGVERVAPGAQAGDARRRAAAGRNAQRVGAAVRAERQRVGATILRGERERDADERRDRDRRRLDPAGEHRLPGIHEDLSVVVVCNEGYASSLAVPVLRSLGLTNVTDLEGGYQAWLTS